MDPVYVPIPQYPPFKLRSSLIDKDPVIWVHLLEGYIKLFQVLLADEISLNVKSQQQLSLFLKGFLKETSQESSQIFSLGAINPDIRKNTEILRCYVFALIKAHSVVKLGLSGDCLWWFVIVYVEKNVHMVRSLIDGTFKSPLNDNRKSSNISSIPSLKKFLESRVTSGQFSEPDLRWLSLLLGQHLLVGPKKVTISVSGITEKGNKSAPKSVAKDRPGNSFAEKFVSADWIELLERLYAGGRSVHANVVKDIMVVSIISLSPAKLANLISVLGINSPTLLMLSPLFASIIISKPYLQMNPGLSERLPFLANLDFSPAHNPPHEKDIEFLVDMFPSLSRGKAILVLLLNDRNVEKVTSILLEDPGLIDNIPDHSDFPKKATPPADPQISESELQSGIERFSLRENETDTKFARKDRPSSAQETKNRTLSAALSLLYEDEEDERDDTYDDQEHTTGLAFQEYDQKPRNKEKARLVVYDDDGDNDIGKTSPGPAYKTEINLFGYFKTNGESAFDKTSRKTPLRAEMREVTKWSDEQIEGWLKMLMKSPKRFRILEEQFAEEFSNRKVLATEKPQKKPQQTAQTKPEAKPQAKPQDRKKVNARNEKNKSSKANHNRKAGHNKKSRAEMAGMQ